MRAAQTPSYVALGDSISIDDYAGGPGRGGASLLARNRDDDFPEWHGADLDGTSLHLLATDGATTVTVVGDQLSRLHRLPTAPSVVTLTVGGNDVLGCYGDTPAAVSAVGVVGRRVEQVLVSVRQLAGSGVALVVGTVYDPSDGTGDAERAGLPPWPEAVAVLGALNDTLRDVARSQGAAVAEIHDRFLGHGLSRGDVAQPAARPADRELWYSNVIEPNAWGAHGVRAAFWEALGHEAPTG